MTSPAEVPAPDVGPPATLKVANRPITIMRTEALGASPDERADAAGYRLAEITRHGGPLQVTTRASAEGVVVLVDGKVAFRVLNGDVDSEAGESVQTDGDRAAENLRKALAEIRESEDASVILKGVGYTLLATAAFALLCWLLVRAYHWLARHSRELVHRQAARLLPSWSSEVLGEAALAGLFTLPLKLFATLLVVLMSYQWAAFVLQRFPYTRPLGESLRDNLLAARSASSASRCSRPSRACCSSC